MKFELKEYVFHGAAIAEVVAVVASVNFYPREKQLVITMEMYKPPATDPFTVQVVRHESTGASNTDIKKAVLAAYKDAHAKRH